MVTVVEVLVGAEVVGVPVAVGVAGSFQKPRPRSVTRGAYPRVGHPPEVSWRWPKVLSTTSGPRDVLVIRLCKKAVLMSAMRFSHPRLAARDIRQVRPSLERVGLVDMIRPAKASGSRNS